MAGVDELLAELSRVLWQQRALVEVLGYRLEVQQLLMISGRDQRLPLAVGEVEGTLAEIRRVEELRDRITADCAAAMGLDRQATLTMIRDRCGDPWDSVLGDHQVKLLELATDAEELAARNRELAGRGMEDARQMVRRLGGEPATVSAYSRRGDRPAAGLALPPSLVDRDV